MIDPMWFDALMKLLASTGISIGLLQGCWLIAWKLAGQPKDTSKNVFLGWKIVSFEMINPNKHNKTNVMTKPTKRQSKEKRRIDDQFTNIITYNFMRSGEEDK